MAAQHAQVVPAAIAAMLPEPLCIDGRTLRPYELARWEHADVLAEEARTRLACDIEHLLQGDRDLLSIETPVQAVSTADTARSASCLTIGALVEAFELTGQRAPLASVLRLLARIEALHWVVPTRYAFELARYREATTPGWITSMTALQPAIASLDICVHAAELPWLDRVEPDDLRLGYELEPSTWMEETPHDAEEFERAAWLTAVSAAERLSYLDELREVATIGALCNDVMHPAPGDLDRWVDAFVARYAGEAAEPRPGDEPMVKAMLAGARKGSLYLPAMQRILLGPEAPSAAVRRLSSALRCD